MHYTLLTAFPRLVTSAATSLRNRRVIIKSFEPLKKKPCSSPLSRPNLSKMCRRESAGDVGRRAESNYALAALVPPPFRPSSAAGSVSIVVAGITTTSAVVVLTQRNNASQCHLYVYVSFGGREFGSITTHQNSRRFFFASIVVRAYHRCCAP